MTRSTSPTPSATRGDRILRVREVLARISVSRSTLYKWMDEGRFPRHVQLGPRSIGWRESEIDEWLASRALAA